jgi:hypothetical protein
MRLRVGNRNGHLCFKSLGGRLAEFFTRVAHIGPCGGRGSNAADNPLQRKYEYPLHGRTYMPPAGWGIGLHFPTVLCLLQVGCFLQAGPNMISVFQECLVAFFLASH